MNVLWFFCVSKWKKVSRNRTWGKDIAYKPKKAVKRAHKWRKCNLGKRDVDWTLLLLALGCCVQGSLEAPFKTWGRWEQIWLNLSHCNHERQVHWFFVEALILPRKHLSAGRNAIWLHCVHLRFMTRCYVNENLLFKNRQFATIDQGRISLLQALSNMEHSTVWMYPCATENFWK